MKDSVTKKCQGCKKEFLIIPQEQSFYEKKKLPTPSNCHECRRNRRKSLRNERKLYQRKCDKCDKDLESTYPKNSPYIIYCEECYYNEVN
ncbi:zinc-ribbon domain containing protein [Patescibacteria group bacterium]|nr:zinc-ribbon domain containing protein [Patescibacteria group bacterium]MBU1683280.1 zinc-ribbon domain containing protein [Patescibacteria group bacterium]MBU1935711.1 zinc-ribbon domain containing protein [Patescibacteria group bacterium]